MKPVDYFSFNSYDPPEAQEYLLPPQPPKPEEHSLSGPALAPSSTRKLPAMTQTEPPSSPISPTHRGRRNSRLLEEGRSLNRGHWQL